MRFINYFKDFVNEARYFSDEKFDWVAKNMGEWILNSTIDNPIKITALPFLNEFKSWLSTNTTKPHKTNDDIILATDYLENFLNFLSQRDAQNFIKEAMIRFPLVKMGIVNYLKPELEKRVAGKRGRPPGSKNKPKSMLDLPGTKVIRRVPMDEPVNLMKIEKQTEIVPEPTDLKQEPKQRGRKKISSEFSNVERSIFKKEGPAYVDFLISKQKLMDSQIQDLTSKIQKLQDKIDRRKKFFGIE